MKIGIITYHFSINYGAVLQCYALQKYLEDEGNSVVVINYIDENQKKNNSVFNRRKGFMNVIDNIILSPLAIPRIKKDKKFKKFVNEKLNCSKELHTIKELEAFFKNENFDYIISGSDQVWNPHIDDFSEAFFLPFDIKSIKVTYAASIGNATYKDLLKYEKCIKDFKYISLREEKSKDIIGNITDKKISIVLDPVTLINKSEWIKLCTSKENYDNYLLCYFLHKDYLSKEYKIAKKIAKEKHLKLIMINSNFSPKSFYLNCRKDVDPIDFLTLFKNARYICTDSFHGTVFSIIFEKDFNCFASNKQKQDSRRESILNIAKLMERLIYVEEDKIETGSIDYKSHIKDFQKQIINSKQYLEKLIKN